MGTAQSSPNDERPAGAFYSCRCLRAGCSAPALASVLPYGLGYAGLGYAGLGYHGLGYAGLGYPYAVAAPAPVEVEVPVTQYKYVPEVKTVELPPACQNAFGFAVS